MVKITHHTGLASRQGRGAMAGPGRTIYAAVLCRQRAVTPQAYPVLHARCGVGLKCQMSPHTQVRQQREGRGVLTSPGRTFWEVFTCRFAVAVR